MKLNEWARDRIDIALLIVAAGCALTMAILVVVMLVDGPHARLW